MNLSHVFLLSSISISLIFQIGVLLENEEKFKKTIQSLNDKLEELNSRLTGQSEIENQLQQKYVQEIESRCKLADVYKGEC